MIRYFAEHPKAANIIMLLLLIVGITLAPAIKKETFPEIEKFEVSIQTPFPGSSAIDVEEGICEPLENATDAINFIDEKRCEAKDNLATMTLKMLENGDMQQFLDDINTAVNGIDEFPDNAEPPIITELGRTSQVISIALSADIPKSALKTLAERYKQQLQQLPEVSIVTLEGFSQHQLNIEISDENLRQYGLSINTIATSIGEQAIDLPSGDIKTALRHYQIRFANLRRTVEQLSDLIVFHGDNGAEIRLGEIATITDTFETEEEKIDFNQHAAAILKISKNKNEDSLRILDAVSQFVDHANAQLPQGVQLQLTEDATSIVKDRLSMLINNGWQGLLLVMLALFLFFTGRYTFWVVMGLPVSFLGSVIAMVIFGISINMISLVALLIAIGILMDDAIVIAESIATEYKKGKTPLDAAVDGTEKVAKGVLSSFLTTVLVFGGLIFLKGDIGQVLKVLPIVLIAVLVVSLIEAFLILPHHLMASLQHHQEHTTPAWRLAFQQAFERGREHVGKLAERAIRYRYAWVGFVLALLLVSISLLTTGVLKFRAFPELDGDILNARILLPQGASLQRTEQVVSQVLAGLRKTDALLSQTEPEALVRNITVKYNKNDDAFESGAHLATVTLDLLPAELRRHTLAEFTQHWREQVGEIPGVIAIQYKQPNFGPAGRPIHIRLQGDDLDHLAAASQDLQQWLRGYAGVKDVIDDLRPGKPQFSIRLLAGDLAAGLDAQTVSNQLRAAYEGIVIDTIQYQGEDYEIHVMLDKASRDSLTDFDYFTIIHPQTSQPIPLAAIAQIEQTRSYGRIARVNGLRTVSIFGDIDAAQANTLEVLTDVKQRFLPDFQQRHPAVSMTFEGEIKNGAKTGGSVRSSFLLGALGIFLLLSWQFRSYIEPIIVMLTIPLALIGVIWGHVIMGLDLTMPSMMGFVSLAGIVVNDSILLVEFIKHRVKEGMPIHTAASQAARDRFRAIFLTSFTTIAGMLPLLFETSVQAQVLVPLVTSITFGLLASTLLILLVLPAMYVILEDFGFTESST